jgi:DHA2 family lincomycin resistance protein-like MFS transporter
MDITIATLDANMAQCAIVRRPNESLFPDRGEARPMSDVQIRPQSAGEKWPEALEPEKVTGRVGPVIAVLVLAAMIMILNETVLSVALPPVMADFAVAPSTAQWLTTGFMLTMAVVIPTTGYLIQRLTIRAMFATALLLFLAGTALAAVATGFPILLAGR